MSDGQYAGLIGWVCLAGLIASDPDSLGKFILATVGIFNMIRSFRK